MSRNLEELPRWSGERRVWAARGGPRCPRPALGAFSRPPCLVWWGSGALRAFACWLQICREPTTPPALQTPGLQERASGCLRVCVCVCVCARARACVCVIVDESETSASWSLRTERCRKGLSHSASRTSPAGTRDSSAAPRLPHPHPASPSPGVRCIRLSFQARTSDLHLRAEKLRHLVFLPRKRERRLGCRDAHSDTALQRWEVWQHF